ncbi:TRAP transporter small permease [Aquibacillus sp. 3ASR75-11]|uniref:TRAP transporter small permease n=1 Tax=Terrihalobacillus insolitus TaxID=2950438 RepID=A0A9X3WYJ1_9BACI|nr:TRAP transporter small permease [Terrihalobacillus insolitus]MDC3414580.1 TRAP transporter small permease [Terrihalobacillus insolitus]MDC3425744.1 TRAP transporter small permease [Terrihalobacillus insolitus]
MKILGAVDKFILKLEEFILSYSILLIALMVVGNVVSRALTGSSWTFSAEVSRFAVTIATFMGISYAARKGRHISMSAFFDLAPFKLRKALAIFIPVVTAVVLFTLAYYSSLYVNSVYESGKVTSALQVPAFYMTIFIPIGLFMGGIQYIRNAWVNIKEKEVVYLGTDLKDYNDEKNPEEQIHV